MRRPPRSAAPSSGNGCKFEAPLEDGRQLTRELFEQWFEEEVELLAGVPQIAEASRLMHDMIVADEPAEFLTMAAYDRLAKDFCAH